MSKKRVIICAFLIIGVLILGFYPAIGKMQLNTKGSDTLKLYLYADGGNYDKRMDAIITEFQKKYPSIKIEKVLVDAKKVEMEAYAQKMLTDTLAGNGPDILLLDEFSTRKLERSEMLLDLKPFIQDDKDFRKDDYNMKVIQAGLYKGEQVIMPLDYYVNQYITTEQLLKSNNINLKDSESQKDFMNALDGYINSASKDRSKYLFAMPMKIDDFLASSGEKFIDYDNKKVYFDRPEFKEIIQNYKKIYNSSKKNSDIQGVSGFNGLDDLRNGNVLFSNDPMDMRDSFFVYESLVNQYIGNKEIISTVPSYKGGDKVNAIVNNSLAISKNTKNKQAAYNFIKIAISEEIQGSNKLPSDIPVNRKAAMNLESQYMQNEVNSVWGHMKDITIIKQPLSNDFQKYYDKVLNNLSDVQITNNEVEQMMMQCLTPYFENKSSYETCIKVLSNKVKLYLNE